MPPIPAMPKNRAIPAVALGLLLPLASLAQDPGAAPARPTDGGAAQGGFALPGAAPGKEKEKEKEAPPTEAEKAIDEAIARLKKATSFSAEVVQTVDMLNLKFEIKGTFLKGDGHRIYLKLGVVGLGDSSATTLQACDGATLWDFRQVLDNQTYIKYTIAPIFKRLADPVVDATIREQASAELGFAGPEAMLQGLRRKVAFNQKAEETFEGKKVWVVRGEWKDRSGLVGPNQQPWPPTTPLPSYVPANVGIWIGQEDGVPYQVEMYGNAPTMLQADARRMGPDNRPLPAKLPGGRVEPSRIVLRYVDAKVNPPLKPEAFAWQPPADAKGVVDMTEQTVARIDQMIQYATAQKKAEAAKEDVTNLPAGIEIKADAPPVAAPAPAPPR